MEVTYIFGTHTLVCDVPRAASDGALLFDDGELTGEPAFDDTGLCHIWPASVVLCHFLAANSKCVEGARVLEIGAGQGLPSLLCTRLKAARVVAIDCNATVAARLNQRFGEDAGVEHGCVQHIAHAMGWHEDTFVELVATERFDLVLLADCVYPMKEQCSLLAALSHLLAEPGRRVIASTSIRDPSASKSFENGLRAMPHACVERLLTDTSTVDPLYGPATVHIYSVRHEADAAEATDAAKATDAAEATTAPSVLIGACRGPSATWRLEAARLQLWPREPPTVAPYMHGWVHVGNERMLRRLVRERAPRVIVELGCWLGLCTDLLLELSAELGSAVFAVDRWDSEYLLQSQRDQYERDEIGLRVLQGGVLSCAHYGASNGAAPVPLHDTFLINLWEHRARLFPLRMDTLEGIATIQRLGAADVVGLVYIDANHETVAVLADLQAATRAFPNATCCGDDWQWASVRAAVEQYMSEQGEGRLRLNAHPAENWWDLEPVVPPPATALGPHAEGEAVEQQPQRTFVEFVIGQRGAELE